MSVLDRTTLVRAGEQPGPDRKGSRRREKYLEVIASSDLEELAQYAGPWNLLACEALEPNIFYESWMLLPALRRYGNADVVVVLVVERDPNAGMKARVVGVFPLERCRRFHGIPIRGVRLWKHPHCYLTNPLIDRAYAQRCWEELLNWLGEQPESGMFLEMPTITGDGTVLQSFAAFSFSRRMPFYQSEYYSRALLKLAATGEEYLRAAMGGDHRRNYARKKKSLGQRGELEVRILGRDQKLGNWTEDFLRLEASGWKGQSASAMACSPADREFLSEICTEAHERRRLRMIMLTLNGQAIAGHLAVHAGEGAFALKIAYEESLRAYSPGVLLELESILELHKTRPCQWVDCCSASDAVAMKRVWKQERQITSVICPTGKRGGRLAVAALPLAGYIKRKLGQMRGRGKEI